MTSSDPTSNDLVSPSSLPLAGGNKNVVPVETYNHVSKQCHGWSSAYKNIEARNKQLEAQISHVNACRDEDANMF